MSNIALFFTLAFIAFTLFLSIWQRVGLEKDIIIGTIRAAIQLIVIGYVLHTIFSLHHWYAIILMIAVMIIVATFHAAKKWPKLKGIKLRIGIAILISETITMGLILSLSIVEMNAQYIIPISGMIIGNSMVVSGLFLNRMRSDLNNKLEELKVFLSLGASSKQAMREIKRSVVKASMIPILDSMKTVGIVQLPGMMTGMIVAGANPIEAVRYQLLIMYSLTSAAAITSIVLSILIHRLLFNESHQINNIFIGNND